MKKFAKLSTLAFAAALLCGSCHPMPEGVLEKEEMAQLLADIHKAEVVIETNSRKYNDSLSRVFRQSIYKQHGVTSEEVDSSLSWYGYNMERYLQVYDRVIEILEDERDAEKAKGATLNTNTTDFLAFEGDSVNVWQGAEFVRFTTNSPTNIITFSMKVDPNWMAGDAYTLRNKLVNVSSPVEAVMAARYRDGSTEFVTYNFNGDGWHELRLALDESKDATEVYGAISYRPVKWVSAYVDSISLTRTRAGSHLNVEARQAMKLFKRNE